jgi:hypothetical protein
MNKMDTEWGGQRYIRVGYFFSSCISARQATDEFEDIYNLSCVVEKVRTRCYIFARGPKYHLEVSK